MRQGVGGGWRRQNMMLNLCVEKVLYNIVTSMDDDIIKCDAESRPSDESTNNKNKNK